MDGERVTELIERLKSHSEPADLLGIGSRAGEQRIRHRDDVVDCNRAPIMCDEKLSSAASLPKAEANVTCSLILCVLHRLLKSAARLAVNLSGKHLAAFDHLVHEPGQVEVFQRFQSRLSVMPAQLSLMAFTGGQQPFDELDTGRALAIDDELHADPSLRLGPGARHSSLSRAREDRETPAVTGLSKATHAEQKSDG